MKAYCYMHSYDKDFVIYLLSIIYPSILLFTYLSIHIVSTLFTYLFINPCSIYLFLSIISIHYSIYLFYLLINPYSIYFIFHIHYSIYLFYLLINPYSIYFIFHIHYSIYLFYLFINPYSIYFIFHILIYPSIIKFINSFIGLSVSDEYIYTKSVYFMAGIIGV